MDHDQGQQLIILLSNLGQWSQLLLYGLEGILFCVAALAGFWIFGGGTR